MKRILLAIAILASLSAVNADPIQLTLAKVSTSAEIQLEPVILTPAQIQAFVSAVSAANVVTLPAGKQITDLRLIRFDPIIMGTNSGHVRMRVSVAQ